MQKTNIWFVYIVRCRDNSLYTGITTDLQKRIDKHNQGKDGAKYTRSRRPVQLVYIEEYCSRNEASKREYQLKQLSHMDKLQLLRLQ